MATSAPDPKPGDFAAIVRAPGFAVGVRCTATQLLGLEFLPEQVERPAASPLAGEAAQQVRAYLNEVGYRFDLPLSPAGTVFRQQVWACISAIPCGETRSYGQLAQQLGSAPRAVGQACGDNPYPLIVPCHRVVSAAGRLGGFNHHGSGYLLDVKRWLLARENAFPG